MRAVYTEDHQKSHNKLTVTQLHRLNEKSKGRREQQTMPGLRVAVNFLHSYG